MSMYETTLQLEGSSITHKIEFNAEYEYLPATYEEPSMERFEVYDLLLDGMEGHDDVIRKYVTDYDLQRVFFEENEEEEEGDNDEPDYDLSYAGAAHYALGYPS